MGIISLNLINYWRMMFFFSIHHKNIPTLAIEIFKFLNGLSLQIMNEVFHVKSSAPHYLRDNNDTYSRNPKTVTCGTESVSFMATRIWSIVHQELKNYQSLYSFKGTGNQTVYVSYTKPSCNVLVLYNKHA